MYKTLLLLALALTTWANAQKPELWFGPGDDLEVGGHIAHPDYAQLFQPNAIWANNADVFMLRAPWVLRTNTSNPAEAHNALHFLKLHHLKIAAPLVGVATDDCGQGTEGTMSERGMNVYPRDMKNLGWPLDYAELDEPFYYGHYWKDSPKACKYSVAETARRTAISVKIVKKYYPQAKFVLIEPPIDDPKAPAELLEFLNDLKAEGVGYPENFRFDIAWSRSKWQQTIPQYLRVLNQLHIPFSFVSDAASGQIHDDAAWVQSAKADTLAFERAIHQQPAEIVIQSWSPNPFRLVPESDPSTMTGLLKWADERRAGR